MEGKPALRKACNRTELETAVRKSNKNFKLKFLSTYQHINGAYFPFVLPGRIDAKIKQLQQLVKMALNLSGS
jgi:hypothetical protein